MEIRFVGNDNGTGTVTIALEGRIDSANAAEADSRLFAVVESSKAEHMILDAEGLEYISSAGLRVILKLRKTDDELRIVNVSSEVYDIFEMTGFTEMIKIEKAYRRIKLDGCEVIGQGANGKVYRLDPEIIVKEYFNPDSLPDIRRERELAKKAFVLGIPTAIPYDIVKIGNGYGSVFELLNARSFAKLIDEEPENFDKYVEMYVELLKKIHSTKVKHGDMPDMKNVAIDWAKFLKDYLPADQCEKLIAMIEDVPDTDTMMHGDYHVKNVMMQNGEALLIDMDTLCVGDPVFELASVYLAYCGYCENDHSIVQRFMGIPYDVAKSLWEKTLKLYFSGLDDKTIAENADKAKIIGYTRMMRRTIRRNGFDTEQGRKDIETCKEHLADLLSRIDDLRLKY